MYMKAVWDKYAEIWVKKFDLGEYRENFITKPVAFTSQIEYTPWVWHCSRHYGEQNAVFFFKKLWVKT